MWRMLGRHALTALAAWSVYMMCDHLAMAQSLPSREGQCSQTTISRLGHRLDDPGTGSLVNFANGGGQVSYDEVPQLARSKVGDKVYICLIQIPTNCPPGDNRGRIYTTTNLRTQESWTLPDSQHGCGGA